MYKGVYKYPCFYLTILSRLWSVFGGKKYNFLIPFPFLMTTLLLIAKKSISSLPTLVYSPILYLSYFPSPYVSFLTEFLSNLKFNVEFYNHRGQWVFLRRRKELLESFLLKCCRYRQ